MDSVLCSANAQSMKYYFNKEEYGILPEEVQKQLQTLAVSYCADVGGVIVFAFDDAYELNIQAIDPIDEIGSELLIRRMQRNNSELFEQLQEFAKQYAVLKTQTAEKKETNS